MDAKKFETFCLDAVGFIDWCIENKKESSYIFENLLHDISGIIREERCFLPRVDGYSKYRKQ
jgi:hypothetical protein